MTPYRAIFSRTHRPKCGAAEHFLGCGRLRKASDTAMDLNFLGFWGHTLCADLRIFLVATRGLLGGILIGCL